MGHWRSLTGLPLFLLTLSVGAQPMQPLEEGATLVMIGFRDAVDESNETEASVRAGISDVNAEVRVEWRETRPDKDNELKMAKEIARQHRALAIFWRRNQSLMFYVSKWVWFHTC